MRNPEVCGRPARLGAHGRSQRGQATVEFALIIPVVILVVVGIIEFGRAFNYWISLNHLSNEGARWAAVQHVPGTATGTFPERLSTYLQGQMLTKELQDEVGTSGVKVCYTPDTPTATAPAAGDAVTVTIKAPHKVGLAFMPSIDVTLTGSSTMRLEQTPTDPAAAWTKCA